MKYESEAQKWEERYNLAASHQERLFKKFAAWYDIANTVYPQDRKVSPWRSKMLFPTLGNKTWQLAAKFVGLKPGWNVKAHLPVITEDMPKEFLDSLIEKLREQEDKAQYKLDYDYTNPELDESMRDKELSVMMDAIVVGTGLAKVPWTTKSKRRYERMPADNYGNVDVTQQKKTTETIGFNDFIPVDIFNVFKSPSGSNLYSSPWVIIKEYKSLSDLKKVNGANGGKFYKGLDRLENAKAESDRFAQYKASRNRILTNQDRIQADTTVNQIPIYECYDLDNDSMCWYADAGTPGSKDKTPWVLLREQSNVYWHGKYPLVAFYIKKKSHDFWGRGIFETNERLDAGKNDIFNHYMDNENLAIEGGIIREQGTVLNDYIVEPGFEITYQGAEPKQWKFPDPNPNQLVTLHQIIDRALEEGTISPYAAGTPNSSTDTTSGTKGGIISLQEAADDILTFGRENFRESITQLGKFWLSNNQQFLDAPMTIKVTSGKVEEPMTIAPMDLQGDFNLEVTEDSMSPLTKDQLRAQFQGLTGQLLQIQQASMQQAQAGLGKPLVIDFNALAEEMGEQFGQKAIDRFILSDQEVEEMMQQQAIAAQEQQAQQMMQQQQMKADQEVQGMTANLAAQGHIDPSVLETQEGTPLGNGQGIA